MATEQFSVQWIDGGREPKCAPNPDYPEGIDLDVSTGSVSCVVPLPYPAKRCGYYAIRCNLCSQQIACTTAGRIDDPRSIKIPCRMMPHAQA